MQERKFAQSLQSRHIILHSLFIGIKMLHSLTQNSEEIVSLQSMSMHVYNSILNAASALNWVSEFVRSLETFGGK